ncbi:NAD+ synthase [Candidatus Liberibacter americanus]|uniref:Glutamine-dependent NAD(+) synthetase n=1 Tax=Candidatus Liberibacter americanus str. Sao Paulo TaxID=1261131 RepID=U6B4F3_9HYPH|nr:NAD+ synthase [Candidatus Liberibacter americanus]AHA27949.1 NAD synthase [Candidatus Liberibacter americanus str. Sao Paulo]EMS35803.1 NAD synthetase [Candidatus Liberibacter americanus PW_SP]
MKQNCGNILQKSIKISIAQLNTTVGDIVGNISKARLARAEAASQGADLILFTELFISGYPPEDLVFKKHFIQACYDAMDSLRDDTNDNGPGIIIGFPRQYKDGVMNSVAILDEGNIIGIRDKINLPNYDEFHEKRNFLSGTINDFIEFRNIKIGVIICEDIWKNSDICHHLKKQGAELIFSINASPYCRDKLAKRHEIVRKQIEKINLPIVYANQVGGQDELVFDGNSFCFNHDNKLAFQMKHCEEQNMITQWIYDKKSRWHCKSDLPQYKTHISLSEELDYSVCVLGLRDYVKKNNFHKALIGISGGIDSALCATMAVDALGKENVQTIMLPYIYTSKQSLEDALTCTTRLGCQYDILPINDIVDNFFCLMSKIFKEKLTGIVAENIQSRIRANILMTISNKSGSILLTTSNKSEISVGYGTIYGDMTGGFNPIKDLYKTQIYRLASWRNSNCISGGLGPSGEVIPISIIEKPPSAELHFNQTDQESLPPYHILDYVIERMVEHEESCKIIAGEKYDLNDIHHIANLLYRSEYKRRQAALGIKITKKSFGRDRLYPISNKFRDK